MGIIQDVFVKVVLFIYHTTFVILDMDEDTKVPLILRRLFLPTTNVLVDVSDGTFFDSRGKR